MSEIRNKAMLVRLNISQWTARKLDRKVSREVAENHNTSPDVGNYHKSLLHKGQLETISKIATQARLFHYANTLPWTDDGERILPAKNFLAYSRKMREFEAAFNTQVNLFVERYPTLVMLAKERLNGLFDERDYPATANVREKFGYRIAIDSLPNAEDFRVDLGASEVALIQADIETRVKAAVAEAMKDLWSRLYDMVSKMAAKLADNEGIFRDSMVENIVELVGLMPRLNLTEDPELERMRREVEEKLCKHDPQVLRDNALVRSVVATDAQAIMAHMAGFMGGAPIRSESEAA